MSKLGVGKEIVTYCSKCKLDLAHTIVVMKDDVTPLKVECRTCGSIHNFKAKGSATAKKKTKTRAPRRSAEEKNISLWEEAMSKNETEPVKYSIKSNFSAGQIIDHPKFGQGVVDKLIDADKVEVIFRTTTKTLIHNK
jgi:hypothetical protein